MREVIIQKWCEFCWLSDETRTAATTTWSLGLTEGEVTNPPVKLIDCCETHHAMMMIINAAHSMSAAQPERAAPRPLASVPMQRDPGPSPEREYCPVCRESLGKGSLIGHVWTQHANQPRPPAPLICPDCGRGFEHATSCGAHRRAAHAYDPLADALDNVPNFRTARAITAKGGRPA
jgi:hypothetical protein